MLSCITFFLRHGWETSKRYIFYLFAHEIVQAVVPLAGVILPKYIIDELTGPQDIRAIAFYTSLLLLIILTGGMLTSFLSWSRFQERIAFGNDFDLKLCRKMAQVDLETMETPEFARLKANAERFLYSDWHGFSYLLDQAVSIIGRLIVFIGVLTIMATLRLWIVALFLALVAVSVLVEAWAKKKSLEKHLHHAELQWKSSYISDLFCDFTYGKEVRLGVMTPWLTRKRKWFDEEVVRYYKEVIGYEKKSRYIDTATGFIQQAAAYAYLIAQVLSGAIGIGSFTMYISAVASFSGALKDVIGNVIQIRNYEPYFEAARQYLDAPCALRESGAGPLPGGPHRIEFKNVSFRYSGQENYVLKDISLTLEPGEKLALVGENGAGKTTFVKLITRLYDPSEGQILLDGVDIRTIDYDSYVKLFSAVFQDYKLFAFTLLENVALTDPELADEAAAIRALNDAGMGERLRDCPKGVHTYVYRKFDEQGFEPSGGEGQKIALARALYRNAPVVILDEPASALDARAEAALYRQFDALVEGKSAVYISHRMSSCRFCDRIVVFDRGVIRETGSHAELLHKNGLYAELYRVQAERYVDG